jgi:enoyl-CoA hydratase
MTAQHIRIERFGAIERITLARPEKRNAQNKAMLEGLDAGLKRAEVDDEVRVVILAADGSSFSAGHDNKELGDDYLQRPTIERYQFEDRYYLEIAMGIRNHSKPVIVQAQGACIAGGFMLAAMADILVASEDAYFSDPTVMLGSAAVEVLFHPWALGDRLARDILFTGRNLTAEEAYQRGFVTRLVARDQLEATAMEIAETIGKAPPFAMQMMKRSLNRNLDAQGYSVMMSAHFDTHQLVHTASKSTASAAERLANFKNIVAGN